MRISLNTSGLDCSGKQTFNEALYKVLNDNGIVPFSNSVFSFPRYEENEWGKSLYHLLRVPNKSEIENVIMDLFVSDHHQFLDYTFYNFLESDSKIIMCDRCSHEPLIFNVGEAYFDDTIIGYDKRYEVRKNKALSLIEYRYTLLRRIEDAVELNLFFMMNGGKSDSDELKRRLDLKQDKDSNETLEFQKTINGRFKKVFEVIDKIAHDAEIEDRVFNIGFSLSTPTENIVQFFLEFARILEKYESTSSNEFKSDYKALIQQYSTFGYICMAVI